MQIFPRYSKTFEAVVEIAQKEALALKANKISTGHLLLALIIHNDNVAAQSLCSMNITSKNVSKELERLQAKSSTVSSFLETEIAPDQNKSPEILPFSTKLRQVLYRAGEIKVFFGKATVEAEHVLLALVDNNDEIVLKILEELGANLTFLKRKILAFCAQADCYSKNTSQIKKTIVDGLTELKKEKLDCVESISELSQSSGIDVARLPNYDELVLMVASAYLADILLTQVGYQRYLLDESIELLQTRVGALDKETEASIVSSAAQNVTAEVRSAIEYLWSHEFRLISQLPSEAEHDLIGSVLEDLWWTHSEEIALNEVFDEALDDYRRKHVLNLQKRRLEISQRLAKLKIRMEETLKQCFFKKSRSA